MRLKIRIICENRKNDILHFEYYNEYIHKSIVLLSIFLHIEYTIHTNIH